MPSLRLCVTAPLLLPFESSFIRAQFLDLRFSVRCVRLFIQPTSPKPLSYDVITKFRKISSPNALFYNVTFLFLYDFIKKLKNISNLTPTPPFPWRHWKTYRDFNFTRRNLFSFINFFFSTWRNFERIIWSSNRVHAPEKFEKCFHILGLGMRIPNKIRRFPESLFPKF